MGQYELRQSIIKQRLSDNYFFTGAPVAILWTI